MSLSSSTLWMPPQMRPLLLSLSVLAVLLLSIQLPWQACSFQPSIVIQRYSRTLLAYRHGRFSSLHMALAEFKKPRRQNVEGNFYVDESCIDCDVCRWMCPTVFSRKGIQSAVHQQPVSDAEKLQALAAMVSCPVGSIRTYEPDPLAKQALLLFPAAIDRIRMPTVFHLGYHSVDSFGATPYFLQRGSSSYSGSYSGSSSSIGISKALLHSISEGRYSYSSSRIDSISGSNSDSSNGSSNSKGDDYLLLESGFANIIIDCPRYNSKLARCIEEEGGAVLMILTHKDDVADHKKWKERFPHLLRVIQRYDVTRDTADCEIILQGEGPWTVSPDINIIHTPGHTPGSISVLYTPQQQQQQHSDTTTATTTTAGEGVLFTGDHLAFSGRTLSLDGFKQYNKGNVDVQAESIRMLTSDEFNFQWILPAHGRMIRFDSLQQKAVAVAAAAEKFEEVDASYGAFGIGY